MPNRTYIAKAQKRAAEKAADGTLWKTLNEGRNVGELPVYTIFKDVSGPTAYAKRHIMLGSQFYMLEEHMRQKI
ncbi:unnamed protein product [Xylocopa violacea]|uniref:Uncharacterized protein n=1 Tax=Xylocopa violacea TaxID=135666 RepID=A0ABP1N8L6_XYLVO